MTGGFVCGVSVWIGVVYKCVGCDYVWCVEVTSKCVCGFCVLICFMRQKAGCEC
mgnify:CR=1 FL=1